MMTDIFDDVKKVFPSLITNTKKGESGVVGVIGGSL
jgi:NAD(P)H-hydrate repair Nnr-like enzyme with NAD(P)H-hydrate dehydratase domain